MGGLQKIPGEDGTDDYGLTPEQRSALDELIPGWEDMPMNEVSARAIAIKERAETDLVDARETMRLVQALEEGGGGP
jgi:hypothetical protein